jgi:hypothetical protein
VKLDNSPVGKIRFALFNIMIPLFVGVFIYFLFRGVPFLNTFPLLNRENSSSFLLSFCLFNLPDGLWLYALLSSLYFIWKNENTIIKYSWLICVIILSIATEYLQLKKIIIGTFDYFDILNYIFSALIFFFHIFFSSKNKIVSL